MTTILNFKNKIDNPVWRILAPLGPFSYPPGAQPTTIMCDLRNNNDRHPFLYLSSGALNAIYDTNKDGWTTLNTFSISLSQDGSSGIFMPSHGPRGTIGAGATTTSFTLFTALPATVGINSLADRGDGRGFKIRIIGNAGGSSGKIEERIIISNTTGTTPTITLDSPLSFIPIAGDGYELLSAALFAYAGGFYNSFTKFDIATGFSTALLSPLTAPVVPSESILIGLDELHVPYDRNPGEGYFGNLIATASGAASITGQAAGGDAAVLANEYRNFQIRVVQDTAIPTAAGQRALITSHTAGPFPVYSISIGGIPAWTVQPSANATFVVENYNDRIIFFASGTSDTQTYTISTNTWDNTTFSVRPGGTSIGTGAFAVHSFGIEPDINKLSRQSFIFSNNDIFFPSPGIDILDIAGGPTGLWTQNIVFGNSGVLPGFFSSFGTGTSTTYEPATLQGRYMYLNLTGTTKFYRFDLQNMTIEPFTFLRTKQPIVYSTGNRMTNYLFIDGNTKLAFISIMILDDNYSCYSIPLT